MGVELALARKWDACLSRNIGQKAGHSLAWGFVCTPLCPARAGVSSLGSSPVMRRFENAGYGVAFGAMRRVLRTSLSSGLLSKIGPDGKKSESLGFCRCLCGLLSRAC